MIVLLVLARLFTALIFTGSRVPQAFVKTADLAPKNMPGASRYNIPPGNGIPTYDEIEADIKKDNARQKMVKELMADREKRMAMVCAEAQMHSKNESEDLDIPKDANAKKRAAASVRWRRAEPNPVVLNDVKTKGYFLR